MMIYMLLVDLVTETQMMSTSYREVSTDWCHKCEWLLLSPCFRKLHATHKDYEVRHLAAQSWGIGHEYRHTPL